MQLRQVAPATPSSGLPELLRALEPDFSPYRTLTHYDI
jgi:hypothetical protein